MNTKYLFHVIFKSPPSIQLTLHRLTMQKNAIFRRTFSIQSINSTVEGKKLKSYSELFYPRPLGKDLKLFFSNIFSSRVLCYQSESCNSGIQTEEMIVYTGKRRRLGATISTSHFTLLIPK